MPRRILLPVLLVVCAGGLCGLDSSRRLTQYVHRIWTTQQGLPPGTIYDIWQTPDGFLWLGTQTGLVRFDGVRFTAAEMLYPKLPENQWIRAGVEDARGALWVGTNDAGIFRLQNGAVAHFSTKEGLPSEQVYCLIPGQGGSMWACTAGGLARLTDGKIETRLASSQAGAEAVRAVCLAPDGKLWAGIDGPMLYSAASEGDSFTATPLRSIPSDASVRAIACRGSSIWVGTTGGLVEIRGGAEHLYTVKDGLADDGVLSLREAADGSLWVGTRGGFSRLRNGEFENFLPQDGLSQSSVSSLYEDREGSLWVGTKQGLNQFVDGRAIPYTVSEGLPSNDARPGAGALRWPPLPEPGSAGRIDLEHGDRVGRIQGCGVGGDQPRAERARKRACETALRPGGGIALGGDPRAVRGWRRSSVGRHGGRAGEVREWKICGAARKPAQPSGRHGLRPGGPAAVRYRAWAVPGGPGWGDRDRSGRGATARRRCDLPRSGWPAVAADQQSGAADSG